MSNVTDETLALIKEATRAPETIAKAYTQALGLVQYNLERPAKLIYPVITPLRNMIARVPMKGGTAVHWKAITGINTSDIGGGVEEGRRGGVISTRLVDFTAPFATLGLEDYRTFESELAAEGFDDARARMIEGLIRSTMITEERTILGGNRTKLLGTPATPTLADIATGGTIGQTVTVIVSVVALTMDGYRTATAANGIRTVVNRPNADGTTTIHGGYSSKISAAQTQVTATDGLTTHRVTGYTAPVAGAFAFAWFWGPTAGAGQTLGAITTINSVNMTTPWGVYCITQNAADANLANDNSRNAYLYDGLLYLIAGAGQQDGASVSGALLNSQATGVAGVGTSLTADGVGGVVEIDDDLRAFWETYNLSPDLILVNSQELRTITNKVMGAGGTPIFRFVLDGKSQDQAARAVLDRTVQAGTVVGNYLNKYTMSGGANVRVMLHPSVPPGVIVYWSSELPYPLSNVSNLVDVALRRDYYQIDWPTISRQYSSGVYSDGVLRMYFPPAFGMRFNIGA